jgi:hypothetical protein
VIKQYQTFELDKDLNPNIKKGVVGVILEILDNDVFEVEFINYDYSNREYKGQFTFTIDSSYIKKQSWYSAQYVPVVVLKYSIILLSLFLITWWIVYFSTFNIPEFIPYTAIKVYGFFLSGYILTILILSQKEVLKKIKHLTVFNLTLIGASICFINELIFQFILSFTETSDKIYYFLKGVTLTTLFCAILSFFVAYQLKTKRTATLILFIVIFFALFKALNMVFPLLVTS